MWGWIAWGIVVLAVWLVVATCVGMLLGRVMRRRDRRVPTGTAGWFPTPPRPGAGAAADRAPPAHLTAGHRPGGGPVHAWAGTGPDALRLRRGDAVALRP